MPLLNLRRRSAAGKELFCRALKFRTPTNSPVMLATRGLRRPRTNDHRSAAEYRRWNRLNPSEQVTIKRYPISTLRDGRIVTSRCRRIVIPTAVANGNLIAVGRRDPTWTGNHRATLASTAAEANRKAPSPTLRARAIASRRSASTSATRARRNSSERICCSAKSRSSLAMRVMGADYSNSRTLSTVEWWTDLQRR